MLSSYVSFFDVYSLNEMVTVLLSIKTHISTNG